jgi:hypothetical protein
MRFSGDLGEEALHHVESGSRVRGEVQVETGMGFEPALYRRRLMGGIVVDDQIESEIGWGLLVDQLGKAQKLAVAPIKDVMHMTLHEKPPKATQSRVRSPGGATDHEELERLVGDRNAPHCCRNPFGRQPIALASNTIRARQTTLYLALRAEVEPATQRLTRGDLPPVHSGGIVNLGGEPNYLGISCELAISASRRARHV